MGQESWSPYFFAPIRIMNRNSALLLFTFATHHAGDIKQMCKLTKLSRPTCTEAISELCGIGYVCLIEINDARFVNNKNIYAITSLGASTLFEVAKSAANYTNNLPELRAQNGTVIAPSDPRSFVSPEREQNPQLYEIRKRNQHISQALTLEELLLPYGFTQENVVQLQKLEHVTLDYAKRFVKSGMQPAQAVVFMEKKWKPPNFDLNEIEPQNS